MGVGGPVRASGLVKRYGELVAVGGIDLRTERGTCLGILGPNGAGKTTTIEMLEGLTQPDEGVVEVLGMGWGDSSREIRERIGVQLQETRLQEKLEVAESLRMFQSFYREVRPVEEVLELVGLVEKAGARFDDLSGGQKQRLALACALINRPEVLFLDEPTTGLDPQARRRVWEIVEDFKAAGGTVLLTTHYMEEAERLSDDLIIFDGGLVIAEGAPAAIIDSLGAESMIELRPVEADLERLVTGELAALAGVKEVRREPGSVTLEVTDTQTCLGELLPLMKQRGVTLDDLRTHRPTLEDVFVHMTGKNLRDE